MRGFPTFMRALPNLLANHPTVQVVIVGGDEVVTPGAPEDGRSWRNLLLEELVSGLTANECIYLDEYPMISSRNLSPQRSARLSL